MIFMKNRLLRRLLYGILVALLLYFGFIFGYGWSSDWQPDESPAPLSLTQNSPVQMAGDSTLRFVIWNVGYCGLGAESDFFYDDEGMWYSGSSMTRSPVELVEKNLRGAVGFLKNTPADFYLLQEVDLESDRSHRVKQYESFAGTLPGYAAAFAINYNCNRVPIPLLEPWNAYGKVLSGLATFSRFQPSAAIRYQLPGQYPMPDRIFQLDRCAALFRIPTPKGKDLVVINIHNSAYDPGDKIKAIQMPYLRDIALSEYAKGNYVVLGGDWNQCPPNFRFDTFLPGNTQGYKQGNIPVDFFPEDWLFAYDPVTPTNRKARDPYVKGETFETLIDFYLVSPNVRVQSVTGVPQGFNFSDHQPVIMEISLR